MALSNFKSSHKRVERLAMKVLLQAWPDQARTHGYQAYGKRWLPVDAFEDAFDFRSQMPRRVRQTPVSVDCVATDF